MASAFADGLLHSFVAGSAVSVGLFTLAGSVGGATAGMAVASMAIPFLGPLMAVILLSKLADAGDKHLKKLFFTKNENKTPEQAQEIVDEWDKMDKEDKKSKTDTPYALKHRVQDGAKAVWREASNWTYFVVGDLMGVPKAKLISNINKQEQKNARRDKIISRIRFLEAKANSMVVPGFSNNRVDAIRARIRYEESRL
jgi:hypothetical protein